MTAMDHVFGRDAKTSGASDPSTQDRRPRGASPARDKSAPKGGKAAGRAGKFYYWSFFIHKWAGLVGAAWLAVLGLTGFLLDHDSWRWIQQGKAPAILTPASLEKSANQSVTRYLQIDPDDRLAQVTGGQRGLWQSRDGGVTWTPTIFPDGDHPQILAIEPDPKLGWKRLWFAADDGVYMSQDRGESAQLATLKGLFVTFVAAGSTNDEMLAVIDKSDLVRFDAETPNKVTPIKLGPLGAEGRPPQIQLFRFIFDLHFGKGVLDSVTSQLMNDVGGLGMFILSLTGLLYWGLPKWWKSRGKRARTPKPARRATIVWLFRLHSATIGIASVLMLLYLAITGIFLGHTRELSAWMKATPISQAWLTPAFGGSSWGGWIESVVAYPGRPSAFALASRMGMFMTDDNGQNWARADDGTGEPLTSVYRLRRIGDKVLAPNGMAGPSTIRGDDSVYREVTTAGDKSKAPAMSGMDHKPAAATEEAGGGVNAVAEKPAPTSMEGMFMPSDVTRSGRRFIWKNSNKAYVTDADGQEIARFNIVQPSDPGTPWFRWLLRVHMGTIFWSEWKWVNDIFAVLAVFLSVTGLIRWWRQKWI